MEDLYRYIKEQVELTPEDIDFGEPKWLRELKKKGKQRPDGRWDFEINVDLRNYKLYQLPLKFGIVRGYFNCSYNNLTTLEGAPEKVAGYFYCHSNNLTTLEGAPKKVKRSFYCSYNNLITLEGAPKKVEGSFDCHNNHLTTLEGAPEKVGGDFNCHSNNLTTLEGAPEKVGLGFYCYNNPVSVEELIKTVDRDYLK